MAGRKVLFVLTSTDQLGNSGHKTGAYLSEITHPYEELVKAGYEIDMVSPLGGRVPLDGVKMDDPINATWMNDEDFLEKIERTRTLETVNPKEYCAIFFAGGHGTMFDFADNKTLQTLTKKIYENNGVVAAVCHGSAALVNVQLSDGSYLVSGHEVSSFTDDEEETVGMEKVVPFLLESKLRERGAHFTSSPKFTTHYVKSGRLITGQNPASAQGVGKALVETLHFQEEGRNLPEQNWCDWSEKTSHEHRSL